LYPSESTKSQARYWLPLVAWLVVIFFFSTDSFSSSRTSWIITPILKFFFPGMAQPQLEFWHVVLRKAGHITEYFILALLAHRSFRADRQTPRPKLFAAALVLVVALSDEYHQSLTLSRASSLVDVGFDCIGGLSALLLLRKSTPRHEDGTVHSHSIL
jgi:VanZ family protein